MTIESAGFATVENALLAMRCGKEQPKQKATSLPSRNDDGLLDIKQAAQVLHISAKWLYRNYKNLPHVLIPAGRKPRIRFRREALERWIAAHSFDWRTQ